MANRERGEQALVVGERTLIARVTTNACVELEELAPGKNWDTVRIAAANGSRKDLCLYFWTIFRDRHPDIAVAEDPKNIKKVLKAMAELIDEAGGGDSTTLGKWLADFSELNEELSTGKISKEKKKGGTPEPAADPPDAQPAAGTTSTAMPASSV